MWNQCLSERASCRGRPRGPDLLSPPASSEGNCSGTVPWSSVLHPAAKKTRGCLFSAPPVEILSGRMLKVNIPSGERMSYWWS